MFDRTKTIKRRRFSRSRRTGGVKGVLLILLLLAGTVGGVAYWRVHRSSNLKQVNVIYAVAERGTFIHEVNGKGSAESAKNIDVASQVEGSATVIYLIPEGSDVKKGELLVELDSSDIDEKLDSQVVTTNSSRATLNNSRATLRSAEISLEEYVEGTFEQNWMEYESTIFDNEQTRKQKADITRFTERLLNLDYSTELQYEIDKVAEENAKNTLNVTNLKKMTLLKYTSEKQITSLMSDIETARAKVDSDKNSYNINLNRENRYRDQSAHCKIKAPQDGQVVYANQDSRRMSEADMIKEGSTVRQRQVLIRLPDKTQMQVRTMINESNISSVKVDMPAKIVFDSMPNRVVDGVVTKVNLYPEIVWMSSAKDYVTLVKIEDDIPELRSGLTAQVRIIADQQEDVLMVPVQCVTEVGKKTYCITYNDGVWGYKEVVLGASNEKQVIILEGLKEGDRVVSGARLYREKVVFPDPDAPSELKDTEAYQQKLAESEAEESRQKEIESAAAEVADGAPGGFPAGFPGGRAPGGPGGGFPGGRIPGGLPANLPPGVDLAQLAQMFGGRFPGGGGSLSNDDLEEQAKKQEEALEYSKSISERLSHDSKIALIEPFFTRTVMEMQRELLAAIVTKTNDLQARVASRQNEITRRQDEIDLLQRTSTDALDASGETTEQRIARLTDEIKTLRGDSDADPMEKISYLEQIDWSKYVSGNDITLEAIEFLLEDSDAIFEEMFPNSQSLDASTNVKRSSSSDESFSIFRKEENSQYGAFKPLFDIWDTNADGRLKPTEFVIGFFTDRKSFQDSETDDDSDKLFAEYLGDETEATEVSMDAALQVADRILRERADVSGSSRRGGPRGARGGQGGFPRGDRGQGEGQRPQEGSPDAARNDSAPSGGDFNRERPQGEGRPRTDARPDFNQRQGGDDNRPNRGGAAPSAGSPSPEGEAVGDFAPPIMEPIQSLGEASSLRQGIALYVDQMDFNGDGILQKKEFVKGYNDIKDVAGKLFASSSLGGSLGSEMGGGGPMGPPR